MLFHSKRRLTAAILSAMLLPLAAYAQTWQPLTNTPTFNAGVSLLLTDGTIMVYHLDSEGYGTGLWSKLTPDVNGSYVNGTWTTIASMPSGYAPLYFASAVLPDGRVICEGGEYNEQAGGEVNLGAIYDPVANKWTSVAPPSGWANIGDASSVVLPNGTFMLADSLTGQAAFLEPTTLTWKAASMAGKADGNNEEGWTLLPDGAVLTVDTNDPSNLTNSEQYFASKGEWVTAGSTVVQLDATQSNDGGSHEIGPGVLLPNGTVFWSGATGNTAVYTPATGGTGAWVAGPTFPTITKGKRTEQLGTADAPGTMEINGNALVLASPVGSETYDPPSSFFEFNGTTLTSVVGTATSAEEPSYAGSFLILPTGEILFTDFTTDIEVFTSAGTYKAAWRPRIESVPTTLTRGDTYVVSGVLLNGVSQGSFYGDDGQMAENYPIVQITNIASGHVFYARTHGHSAMPVHSTATVTTNFDVPTGAEAGASDLRVIADGIPSKPVAVTLQ